MRTIPGMLHADAVASARRVAVRFWSCLPAFCVAATVSAATGEVSQRIDALAEQELAESGAPSLQIAVAHDGRVIFQGAYGLADVEQNVPATVHSKYRTASVSKWLTATAALALVEQGKLDLDAPIQRYCPSFPAQRSPITTRHLLRHESGIRHELDHEAAIERAASDEQRLTLERRRDRELLSEYTRYTDVITPLDVFSHDALLFEPGTSWSYSSPGYRVVGCVLEGAGARRYSDLLRELILERSMMRDTLPDDAWAIIPNRVAGYHLERGTPLRRAELTDVSGNLPAGGHLSTATDLVKFADAFIAGKLVSSASIALMLPKSSRTNPNAEDAWRDAIPSRESYGYGLMAFPHIPGRWIGHTGRQPGGSAIVIASPDTRISIAVMTNVKGWNGYIGFIDRVRTIVEEAATSEH